MRKVNAALPSTCYAANYLSAIFNFIIQPNNRTARHNGNISAIWNHQAAPEAASNVAAIVGKALLLRSASKEP